MGVLNAVFTAFVPVQWPCKQLDAQLLLTVYLMPYVLLWSFAFERMGNFKRISTAALQTNSVDLNLVFLVYEHNWAKHFYTRTVGTSHREWMNTRAWQQSLRLICVTSLRYILWRSGSERFRHLICPVFSCFSSKDRYNLLIWETFRNCICWVSMMLKIE